MGTESQSQSDFMRELGEVVQREQERWQVPGIAVGVLRDGEIETASWGVTSLETNWPVTADTLFQIGSISKIFTTTLLMTLVDDGSVDLDGPVSTYLPDLRLSDERALENILVRHLVSHQSGIWGDYFDDFGWGEDALTKSVANMHTLRQMYQPTELWSYTNSGFNLAGTIIEKTLGKPFETAMRERVIEPLGLGRTFYFPHEVYAYPHAVGHRPEKPGDMEMIVAREFWLNRAIHPAGGVHSTVRDLLVFDQFHLGLSDEPENGKSVLSESSRLEMQRTQRSAANFADEWGLGWEIRYVDGARVIGHGGSTNGFQAHDTLIPKQGVAFAVLTNGAYGSAAIRGIERWLFQQVAGLNHRDAEPIELTPEQLSRFAGEYTSPRSRTVISVQDNGLRVSVWSANAASEDEQVENPPYTVKPISEREFIATTGREEGSRTDFIENPDGSIRFVRIGGRLSDRQ